jgi:deoxycytidylate deaminase
MNLIRLTTLASLVATNSCYHIQLGCVIFKGKRIVSTGYNVACRSVRSINRKFIKFPGSIHAEVAAILAAKQDLKGCDILVVRLGKMGLLAQAKPCPMCMNYLDYVGIRQVWYSDTEGKVVKENGR